jgi:hypothetical protein
VSVDPDPLSNHDMAKLVRAAGWLAGARPPVAREDPAHLTDRDGQGRRIALHVTARPAIAPVQPGQLPHLQRGLALVAPVDRKHPADDRLGRTADARFAWGDVAASWRGRRLGYRPSRCRHIIGQRSVK